MGKCADSVSKKNVQDAKSVLTEIDDILGLGLENKDQVPEAVKDLAEERKKARTEKNWAESDRIRDEITKLGYTVEDTSKGAIIKKL